MRPALLSPFTLSLTLSHRGRGNSGVWLSPVEGGGMPRSRRLGHTMRVARFETCLYRVPLFVFHFGRRGGVRC